MGTQLSELRFNGYQRSDGSVGVRNHVLVIPTDVNSVTMGKQIMNKVSGTVSITSFPQSESSLGHQYISNFLSGLALNPNVGSTILLSLDDQSEDCNSVYERVSSAGREVRWIKIVQEGGELEAQHKSFTIAREMVERQSRAKRTAFPLNKLTIGLECGGSDTTSGLASNPSVGVASDMIVEAGGTSVISEVPEFIGAEHLFAARAMDKKIKEDVLNMVTSYEETLKRTGLDFRGAQPTPGNQAGGLTTIEEKSLGAVLKAGKSRVSGVLNYAERAKSKGVYLMNTPGYDVESVTGKVAGGAQIVLFTTGRGTPLGNIIAPVIKITANPKVNTTMNEHIDIDASGIITGSSSIDQVGRKIFDKILSVASGKITKSEDLGHNECSMSQMTFS